MVVEIVKDVMCRLTSLAAQELGLLLDFKKELLDLHSTFSHIQAVLEDAESNQKKNNKAIQDWMRKLRAVSYEMENILDEVSTEDMIRRVDRERGIKKQVSAFFSAHNPIAFRSQMAHQLKNIRRKLEAIAAEKSKLGLQEGVNEDKGVASDMRSRLINMRSRLTASLVNDLEILGRDEEKEMIVEKICDENMANDGNVVSVYSIWGMGGIGKTTLSQIVYNHQRVTEHFSLKMWVCVSDDFDILRLSKAILECVEKRSCDLTQLDLVQQRLHEELRGKRFLLVLDDVWNEDRSKWERLRQILDCGAKGSMIMVTTRMVSIARMMSTNPEFVQRIGCLPEKESWSLFKRLAFGVGRLEGNVSELEPIGRAIVEKCQGLPLAVKALGSLMWSKSSVEEWSLVRSSDIWDLPQHEQSILPALRLSYDNLPQHFRPCFAYCCVFPKDYEMEKELMIQLWMANGFIPYRREADLYAAGEEIFNGLIWRSFFEDAGKEWDGMKTYKIHDLMHDLAKFVMGNECSFIEPGMELKFPTEVLHIWSSSGLPTQQDLSKVRSLRSMFIFDGKDFTDSILLEISGKRYLRALNLERIRCKKLPKAICNIKLLRYLNLSWSDIEVLPESIIYLQNLQVLNLFACSNLVKLPKGIRYMKKLQFLDIRYCYKLQSMPCGIGKLAALRRLSRFVVGEKNGKGIEELGELNLLGWEMEISRLNKVRGTEDAKGAKLKNKQNLMDLTLKWQSNSTGQEKKSQEVVECLEPHPNLMKLEIYGYNGFQFPRWMVNLVNLVEVGLFDCGNCEILPPRLGKLPILMVLRIRNMDALKSFDDDNNSMSTSSSAAEEGVCFPCLQKLWIYGCPRLVGLPDGIGMWSCLQLSSLEIYDCPKLKHLQDGLQNLKALKSLRISRCEHLMRRCEKEIGKDWPKIAHVTHIKIDNKVIQSL